MSFGIPRHQHKKGQYKVYDDIQIEEQAISFTMKSLHIINRLFRNVCIIDQQELGKPEIRPKNRESKDIFTHIMDMVFIDHRKITSFFQKYSYQGQRGKSSDKPGRKYIPAKQCGQPVRIYRHYPVPWSH